MNQVRTSVMKPDFFYPSIEYLIRTTKAGATKTRQRLLLGQRIETTYCPSIFFSSHFSIAEASSSITIGARLAEAVKALGPDG